MKIGLLLGSFDPPHMGHVASAVYALNHGMDMVWVVPCWRNPCKTNQTDFRHRFNMCFDTFKGFDKVYVFSDDESIKSSTTYEYLNKAAYIKNPDNEYFLLVGTDVNISSWYNGKWISDNFPVLKIPRLGYDNSEALGIMCSSTNIRNMIKEHKIIYPYLSLPVIKYIKSNNLYG